MQLLLDGVAASLPSPLDSGYLGFRNSPATDALPASLHPPQGVQLLLDGVTAYLPSPLDVSTTALDAAADEEEVSLSPSSDGEPPGALTGTFARLQTLPNA